MKIKNDFLPVDAQQMHKDHPDTFKVPSTKDLNGIKRSSIVKICVSGERFWTEVEEVDGDRIVARVDNDLLGTEDHGLRLNDRIAFEKKNIYSIF